MTPASFSFYTCRLWKAARRGFSLVEMMACVSIIGIIAFMAIPSITRMRADSERNLAVTRAEALNLAQATFIQAKGRTEANQKWNNVSTDEARYTLVKEFLSYPESSLKLYMPADYTVKFAPKITDMIKASLTDPTGKVIAY